MVVILSLFIPLAYILKRFDPDKKKFYKGKPCSYYPKDLLTRTEFKFFKELEPIAEKKNLLVFPKVRVSDILDVDKSKSGDWNKGASDINGNHFDFVLCYKDSLRIKEIVELDDATHEQPDIKEKDKFKNEIAKQCGYKLIRFPVGQNWDFSIL